MLRGKCWLQNKVARYLQNVGFSYGTARLDNPHDFGILIYRHENSNKYVISWHCDSKLTDVLLTPITGLSGPEGSGRLRLPDF